MTLPISANTTCDIYQLPNVPPAAPDVAGVKCHLQADFRSAHEAALGVSGAPGNPMLRWTHIMLVDVTVDVRDNYQGPDTPDQYAGFETFYSLTGSSAVFVPDKNGTVFYVVFVERVGYGSGNDHKRVFLQRSKPTWPTNNL